MELPKNLGNNYVIRLSTIYSILYNNKYGIKPRINYGLTGKMFKDLIDDYTEYQIAYLLIVFFEWKGANGDDDSAKKWLEGKTHGIFLFNNELINSMRVYIQNVLKVDFDNEDGIKTIVNNLINN